jgi:hypothetical protein
MVARMAISRCRDVARASVKLAILAQAISSTNATAASNTKNARRESPTTRSCTGSIRSVSMPDIAMG